MRTLVLMRTWIKSQYKSIPPETDIITLRDQFFESHNKEGVPNVP